jgi:protein-L-isoaspartate(D-aspartate) O-methyltransferase
VLRALERVRREGFVPPEHADAAPSDRPISIAHGQVTTQPSLVARMVEALRLTGRERVLEVGTGLGYQAAILAVLAREVISVERFPNLAAEAERNLRAAGIDNVTVVVGDGTRGAPEQEPFDAVVIAAASPRVPPPLVDQLAEDGRLVHPVGPGGAENVTLFRKKSGELVPEGRITPAQFVPLVGEHAPPGTD